MHVKIREPTSEALAELELVPPALPSAPPTTSDVAHDDGSERRDAVEGAGAFTASPIADGFRVLPKLLALGVGTGVLYLMMRAAPPSSPVVTASATATRERVTIPIVVIPAAAGGGRSRLPQPPPDPMGWDATSPAVASPFVLDERAAQP